VHIRLENVNNSAANINIMDMQGRTVATMTSNGEKEINLNLGNQNSGIYVAAITINGRVITRKIILQD